MKKILFSFSILFALLFSGCTEDSIENKYELTMLKVDGSPEDQAALVSYVFETKKCYNGEVSFTDDVEAINFFVTHKSQLDEEELKALPVSTGATFTYCLLRHADPANPANATRIVVADYTYTRE